MSVTIEGEVQDDFRLFAGRANPELAKEIAAILGVELGKISLAPFPNGETRVQIEESIRGTDVYIIQPTCHPANDHLMELLLTMDDLTVGVSLDRKAPVKDLSRSTHFPCDVRIQQECADIVISET